MLDNAVHVVPMSRNSGLGKTVEVGGIKHIPAILKTRNENHSGRRNATFGETDLDFFEPLACGVDEPKEDQTIPPPRYKIVVSELAGHDWETKRESGCGMKSPFRLPTLVIFYGRNDDGESGTIMDYQIGPHSILSYEFYLTVQYT